MSEGITVRAELPSGIAHAAALNISTTQIPLVNVFVVIPTSKEYVELDAVDASIVCQPQGEKAKRKGRSCSKQGAGPVPLSPAITRLSCGFSRQILRLSPTPD